MKNTVLIVLAFLTGLIGCSNESSSPRIESIKNLEELIVLKVFVTDGVIGRTKSKQCEVVYLFQGDALLSVNMKSINVVTCDNSEKTIKVSLPEPKVLQSGLNFAKKTEMYKTNGGLFTSSKMQQKIHEECRIKAAEKVAIEASSPKNIQKAKEEAECLLKQMFGDSIGWKVDIEWRN